MENTEIKAHLETIDFYVSQSEEIRDNLEVTDAKHFPQKTRWLVRKYKECIKRILFECRISLTDSQDNFSLTPEQQAAMWSIEQVRGVYEQIDKKINLPPSPPDIK